VGAPVSGPSAGALYWHIGAIHARLGKVTPRRVYGVKRLLDKGAAPPGGHTVPLVRTYTDRD
jgi:hypothetical protein